MGCPEKNSQARASIGQLCHDGPRQYHVATTLVKSLGLLSLKE